MNETHWTKTRIYRFTLPDSTTAEVVEEETQTREEQRQLWQDLRDRLRIQFPGEPITAYIRGVVDGMNL